MRRDMKILLTTAGLGAVWFSGESLTESIAEMDTFRVADVQVQGVRYLSEEDVVALLDLTPQSSVWSDTEVWSDRVMAHPLVELAQVTRRLPDGLLVEVTERIPIALAPTPTLEPIDAEGYRLPLDPATHRLDLPVISTSSIPPVGAQLVPDDVRRLAGEVRHLMSSDTAFLQRVSSVAWMERGALVVRWTDPPVDFLLLPRISPARLREGLDALNDAAAKTPDRLPTVIDLRYEDQVVVRRAQGGGS
jgi:cell division septal protein FtsQ